MFIEEDEWNDEPAAQALSNNILSNTQKTNSLTTKSKSVGKKSLLRTLQTLGSVPDWKSDAPQGGSDSETEAVQPHTKRKHKRKRPKQTDGTVEEVGSRVLHVGGKEKKNVAKKLKKKNIKPWSHKSHNTDSVEADSKETPKTQRAEVKTEDETKRMSRKQWKTKMKNKRKCKNKYRLNKPEQGVTIPDTPEHSEEQLQDDSPRNVSERVNQVAAIKRKVECIKAEKETSPVDKQTHKKEVCFKKIRDNHVEADKLKCSGQETKQEVEETQALKTGKQQQQKTPSKRLKLEESKVQNHKREKLRNLLHSRSAEDHEVPTEERDEDKVTTEKEDVNEASADKSASLRSRMEQRLESSRFRYINEVLYTSSSGEAKRMFHQDPQAFGIYHRGFTAQVQRWPSNPVDAIIAYIRNKPASLVVADFGSGDCKIARSVKNKVYSFDLAAVCDLVTVCDMAHVPLGKSSVDIAVFCLALMGTNLGDFLAEANRVLVMGGVLKIAEVASRFNDVRSFLTAMANLGFLLKSKDTKNSHFYLFEFVKTQDTPENAKKSRLQLKPCLYKKR